MNRADRKKQLIAQGALYRTEVLLAKQATQDALQPDSLARNTWHQMAIVGMSLLKNRSNAGLSGMNLQVALPLLMTGMSALAGKKALLKTLLRGALVAGAVAGTMAFVFSKKKAAQAQKIDMPAEQDFIGPE